MTPKEKGTKEKFSPGVCVVATPGKLCTNLTLKTRWAWGAWWVQSEECANIDLGVRSSSPALGAEITNK